MKQWYDEWFDSKYYHILYQNRDFNEAALFIENLLSYLKPLPAARFLDLACGKGRHAIQVNKHGYDTQGCDYSTQSIQYASQFETPSLHFYEQDMRLPIPHQYDYILNLFTSFGYFDTHEEHLRTVQNIYNALDTNGIFVLDFLNANFVITNLIPKETKIFQDIKFDITRRSENGYIFKDIDFNDENNVPHSYTEKVRAFAPSELELLFKEVGFTIQETFGNYDLMPFDSENSERYIALLKKNVRIS